MAGSAQIESIIMDFSGRFNEKERAVAESIIEYLAVLERMYNKGAKETCFQFFDNFLSSKEIEVLALIKKDPVNRYVKPAFSALDCSNIYSEYLNWGLANIISEKAREIERE